MRELVGVQLLEWVQEPAQAWQRPAMAAASPALLAAQWPYLKLVWLPVSRDALWSADEVECQAVSGAEPGACAPSGFGPGGAAWNPWAWLNWIAVRVPAVARMRPDSMPGAARSKMQWRQTGLVP